MKGLNVLLVVVTLSIITFCLLFSIICCCKRKSHSPYLEQSSFYDYEYENETMEGQLTSKNFNKTIETKKDNRKM